MDKTKGSNVLVEGPNMRCVEGACDDVRSSSGVAAPDVGVHAGRCVLNNTTVDGHCLRAFRCLGSLNSDSSRVLEPPLYRKENGGWILTTCRRLS